MSAEPLRRWALRCWFFARFFSNSLCKCRAEWAGAARTGPLLVFFVCTSGVGLFCWGGVGLLPFGVLLDSEVVGIRFCFFCL